MTRREMREHCFKMLFSADFYSSTEEAKKQMQEYFFGPDEDEIEEDGSTVLLHCVRGTEKNSTALTEKVNAILEQIPELDAQLDEVAAGWKTRRMGKVELTILRLALYEMKNDDSVPEKVAINEAVELAKKFGGNESPAFVNGILAKFVTEPKEEPVKECAADAQ